MKMSPQHRMLQTHHLLVSRRLPSSSHSARYSARNYSFSFSESFYDIIHIMIMKKKSWVMREGIMKTENYLLASSRTQEEWICRIKWYWSLNIHTSEVEGVLFQGCSSLAWIKIICWGCIRWRSYSHLGSVHFMHFETVLQREPKTWKQCGDSFQSYIWTKMLV